MKKYLFILTAFCVIACGDGKSPSNKQNTKEVHDDHDGHDHGSEDHDHGSEAGHDDHDGYDHAAPKTAKVEEHADEIIFTPEQAKAVGLELLDVHPSDFHQVIKTSGQIISAQGDEVNIAANANGIVHFTRQTLTEGVVVKNGEQLLSISSKNTADGDPVQKSRLDSETKYKALQRATALMADQLISQKEFDQIKLEYETSKITYDYNTRGTSIAAPMAGYIKAKLVSEGEYVTLGQPLMSITKNQKLQLRVEVSERYYKDLNNILSANFKLPYDETVYRLADLGGRLISFGKSANSQSYFVPINFEFNNVGQLISGTYTEVYLLSKEKKQALTVPLTALVEEQSKYTVYVQLDAEGYQKRNVTLGQNDGDRVEVLSGIVAGEKIVSKGAMHVKLAAGSGAIPHGHTH